MKLGTGYKTRSLYAIFFFFGNKIKFKTNRDCPGLRFLLYIIFRIFFLFNEFLFLNKEGTEISLFCWSGWVRLKLNHRSFFEFVALCCNFILNSF